MKLRPLFVCFLCACPPCFPPRRSTTTPHDPLNSCGSGVQAFHRGFYNDAWVSLEKAISYQPKNSLAQIWLGRAQWKAGYEQEALRTWQQLLDSGAGGALVRDWIGILNFRRGLGRDLSGKTTWVVSAQLDGMLKGGYQFRRPTSIKPRANGSFWVVAFGSNEVLRFDPNFRLLDSFRGGLEGFDRPYDVVEAEDGSFFVSEYGANRIAKCNARGEKVSTFGRTGRADGLLLGPQYMTLDSRGYLWVTDWGNSRVVRFATDGSFVQSIPGINGPTGIAAYEDRLYVSEKAGKRILVYDLNGNPLTTLGEGTLDQPEGITFTAVRHAPGGGCESDHGVRSGQRDLDRQGRYQRADEEARTAGRHAQRGRARRGLRPEQDRAAFRHELAVRRPGRARRPGELRAVPHGLRRTSRWKTGSAPRSWGSKWTTSPSRRTTSALRHRRWRWRTQT